MSTQPEGPKSADPKNTKPHSSTTDHPKTISYNSNNQFQLDDYCSNTSIRYSTKWKPKFQRSILSYLAHTTVNPRVPATMLTQLASPPQTTNPTQHPQSSPQATTHINPYTKRNTNNRTNSKKSATQQPTPPIVPKVVHTNPYKRTTNKLASIFQQKPSPTPTPNPTQPSTTAPKIYSSIKAMGCLPNEHPMLDSAIDVAQHQLQHYQSSNINSSTSTSTKSQTSVHIPSPNLHHTRTRRPKPTHRFDPSPISKPKQASSTNSLSSSPSEEFEWLSVTSFQIDDHVRQELEEISTLSKSLQHMMNESNQMLQNLTQQHSDTQAHRSHIPQYVDIVPTAEHQSFQSVPLLNSTTNSETLTVLSDVVVSPNPVVLLRTIFT